MLSQKSKKDLQQRASVSEFVDLQFKNGKSKTCFRYYLNEYNNLYVNHKCKQQNDFIMARGARQLKLNRMCSLICG